MRSVSPAPSSAAAPASAGSAPCTSTACQSGPAPHPCPLRRGKSISTIESLSVYNTHTLQKAWIAHDVPQCGYCQSGQLMSAAALLKSNKNPSDADIDAAMSGNVCRCGTYGRIKAAIKTAAADIRKT